MSEIRAVTDAHYPEVLKSCSMYYLIHYSQYCTFTARLTTCATLFCTARFSAAWCEPSPTCMPTHTLPTTLPYSLKRPRCPSFLLVQVITIIVVFFSSVGGLMVNCQTAGIFCFSTTESINLYHRSSIVKWKTI